MSDQPRHEELVCQEFVELVTEYLDDALPEDQRDLVEEHLVICEACTTYLEQFEATVAALPSVAGDDQVSDETRATLMSAFRNWRTER